MAHSVTHTFVSPVADDSDPNEVGPDEWNAAHTVTLDADELLTSIKTVDGTGSGLDADTVDGNEAAALLARANHTGTQTLATISDAGTLAGLNDLSTFDTGDLSEGSNLYFTDERAQDAVGTILVDSSEIDFTYSDATPSITAALVAGSIDETKLDTSVNASLDLADSALQSSDIGTSVQAWDAQLDSLSSASANGVSLVTAANYAAMRGLLDLEAGTDFYSVSAADAAFQPLDSDLTAIAGLSRTRGDLIRGGASAWERYALGTSGYALKSDGTDAVWAASREVLTANRTYYIRTDGSDSNNGLTDSSGGAFLTLQKAVDVALTLDLAGYDVTLKAGDGTYAAGVYLDTPFVGGIVTLEGNTATPTSCDISTAGDCVTVDGFGVRLRVKGFEFTSSGSNCLFATNGGLLEHGSNQFGAATSGRHVRASEQGVIKNLTGLGYTIAGNTADHALINTGGMLIYSGITITLSGTPAWSTQGFNISTGGQASLFSVTFSGSATGKRYTVNLNGILNSFGAGTASTYFPGNSNGTTATGGQQA